MRIHPAVVAALFGVAGLAACGGGDDAGEPLLAGALTAEYDGTAFSPAFGFATLYQDAGLLALGDGPIHCGTETANEPPSGRNLVASIPTLTPGTYASVFVQMFENVDDFEGVGSSDGAVTLTAVTDDTVAGSIAYDYTDGDGRRFAMTGDFEVLHCAP